MKRFSLFLALLVLVFYACKNKPSSINSDSDTSKVQKIDTLNDKRSQNFETNLSADEVSYKNISFHDFFFKKYETNEYLKSISINEISYTSDKRFIVFTDYYYQLNLILLLSKDSVVVDFLEYKLQSGDEFVQNLEFEIFPSDKFDVFFESYNVLQEGREYISKSNTYFYVKNDAFIQDNNIKFDNSINSKI